MERYTGYDLARDVYSQSDRMLKKHREEKPPVAVPKKEPVRRPHK
jgi:hypothetical protein